VLYFIGMYMHTLSYVPYHWYVNIESTRIICDENLLCKIFVWRDSTRLHILYSRFYCKDFNFVGKFTLVCAFVLCVNCIFLKGVQ